MGARMGHAAFATQSLLNRGEVMASRVECPTLIIAAAQDALRGPEETRELALQLPGACLQVIEGSGHMIPLEQPEALARSIMHWLAAIG